MNNVITYFKEAFETLREVTWPTKNQAIRYTVITFTFCAIIGVFLTLIDFAFHAIYEFLILS